MRGFSAALLLGLLTSAISGPAALAYTCGSPTLLERLDQADVVFEGIVIASEAAPDNAMSRYRIDNFQQYRNYRSLDEAWAQIYVTENFKGKTNKLENLWIDQWGYAHGYYPPGTRAVFFAYYSEDHKRLETDICSDTVPVSRGDERSRMNAEDFWKELGKFELD